MESEYSIIIYLQRLEIIFISLEKINRIIIVKFGNKNKVMQNIHVMLDKIDNEVVKNEYD